MYVLTHWWRILLGFALCVLLVVAVQFLRIARYEYMLSPSEGYLLRIDRLRGQVCWIPIPSAASQTLPEVLSIEPCAIPRK
jgi:hypothetical protein